MSQNVCVGIDVSKDNLEVAVLPSGEAFAVTNDYAGVADLVGRIEALAPDWIIMEASGKYEILAASTLAAAGLPVVIVNARHARDYAKSTGQLAKTDKIDARLLADFGLARKPQIRPIPDDRARLLSELVARRRQLVDMLVAEKNRLGMAAVAVAKRIKAHIAWLNKELDQVNRQTGEMIRSNPVLQEKDQLIRSVKCAGPVLSATLIADMPELGSVSGKQAAALGGTAPFVRTSGKHKGYAAIPIRIGRGRENVRKALYMACLSAIRYNPVIKEFYHRLLGRGKKAKVAMVACMRKFLVILNAILKHKTPWQPPLTRTQNP